MLLLRRLDRLSRGHERMQRDMELLAGCFALYLQFWFAHTPPIPPEEREGARKAAAGRYKQFMEHYAAQFAKGKRFVDDLPQEILTDVQELYVQAKADAPPVVAVTKGQ